MDSLCRQRNKSTAFLHLFSRPNKNKRLEMGPILLEVLPLVLIFRNVHAIFLNIFCKSALIYPNLNQKFHWKIFIAVCVISRISTHFHGASVLNHSLFAFSAEYYFSFSSLFQFVQSFLSRVIS